MEIDKRILNLSYSSRNTLHKCARKFQLYRLNSKSEDNEGDNESLTFAYGHCVGKGVQDIFEGKSLQQTIWEAFLAWNVDLLYENTKQSKSFFGALHAIRQLYHARQNGFLGEYDLVYWEGKPATELSFSIALPDGFIYRGFVDAVLRNRNTGAVVVLECKTTSLSRVNPAQYKNSAQAIGYSIVLDALFPDLSSYEVYYLIYQTKSGEWVPMPFEKTYFQRALWLRELLLDVETIKLYEAAQIYPMNGESCFDFFRECEYLQHCTMSTHLLVSPLSEEGSKKIDDELAKFQIKIGIQDLIESQVKKNTIAPVADVAYTMIANGDELL
jgi:hypothetical protein